MGGAEKKMPLKRRRRLYTLLARIEPRAVTIRDAAGISRGNAYEDGRFEPSSPDNFRYARQILAGMRLHGTDKEARRNLIGVARYIRLDETRYRLKGR